MTWTCHDCDPPSTGPGGQDEFYQHWSTAHGHGLVREQDPDEATQ